MKKFILSFIFLLFVFQVMAQKQGNHWFFGDGAGIEFVNGNPVSLNTGQTSFIGCPACHAEGSAVMSDSSGALLMYTDNKNVWNKNHQLMPNGNNLLSSFSSTQGSLIVPKPGSDSLYYIFNVGSFYQNGSTPLNFGYSVVNMCLDGGLGDVIVGQKNILLTSGVAEKLTGVRHANGVDYWILVHGFNSNAFYAFLFTSSGIQGPAVVSNVGTAHTGSLAATIGQMKASPNGQKIALVNGNSSSCIAEYFNFNNATGVVSNPVNIQTNPNWHYYGVSFSPDNSKLYISCILNGNGVYQFDLNAGGGNPTAVVASKTQVAFTSNYMGLQLANNGKIYVTRSPFTTNTFLSVINNPNLPGLSCNFVNSAVNLNGNVASYGFPNFIDSYDYSNGVPICSCITSSTTTISNCGSYTWTNGVNYTQSGTYSQTLTNAAGCDSVSTLILTIDQTSTSNTPVVACDSYTWTNGVTYAQSGTYSQILINAVGCDSIATLNLIINSSSTSITPVSVCDSYTWTNGVTYTQSGSYTQILTNAIGCDSIATLNLTIFPSTTSITNISVCTSYAWTNGVTYNQSGTYSQLLTNAAGCDSLASLNLTVLLPTASVTNISSCENYTWTDGITYTQSGTYTQILTNAAGCDSLVALNLTIVFPTSSVTNVSSCDSYTWTDGITYTQSGTYTQSLTNAAGCDSVATLNLIVIEGPLANFNLINETVWTLGSSLLFENTSQNYTQSNWLLNDVSQGNSTDLSYNFDFSAEEDFVVTLIVTNDFCVDSITKIIFFNAEQLLYVPNSFTPDGDEHNPVFLPIFSNELATDTYSLTIYNRWGEALFVTEDFKIGWDGTYKNIPVPTGSYIWKIKIFNPTNSDQQELTGHVLLLR